MKIVMATGGSGGHIVPALKVARKLKANGHEIFFLGSFKENGFSSQERIEKEGFVFKNLNARGLSLTKFRDCLDSVISMAKASIDSFFWLRNTKPDAVCGFGGYGAFPVVFSAVFLKYSTLIHEQNVVPGRANKLLSFFVEKIAISFAQSEKYFKTRKTILTGCPCHRVSSQGNKETLRQEFGLEGNKTTILVLGGSQGSQHINDAFLETINTLRERLDFQVIHVCGAKDFAILEEKYDALKIPFALFKFLDDIEKAYCMSDVVISRAGAVTITEIMMAQLPAILIPYPFAGGHQKENAAVLRDLDTVKIIDDQDLSAAGLQKGIMEIVNNRSDFAQKWRKNESNSFPNATDHLVQEVIGLSQ